LQVSGGRSAASIDTGRISSGTKELDVTLSVKDVRIDVVNNAACVNLRGFDADKGYLSVSVQFPMPSELGSPAVVEAIAKEEAVRVLRKAIRSLTRDATAFAR
jgi:hypothetical protein